MSHETFAPKTPAQRQADRKARELFTQPGVDNMNVITTSQSCPPVATGAFFTIFTDYFGYPMWAAADPDIIYTDMPHEIAYFEASLNDGEKMAKIMSRECGYQWRAVNAGSPEHQEHIAAHYAYKAQQAAFVEEFKRSQRAKLCAS